MQDEEIKQKIASFPRWHYQFDLRGNLTPIHKQGRVNRHTQRKKLFFDPVVGLFGGSLEGKRVLDLACNAGYWSLASIEAGADYVLGIEGRQMHVDQASFVFEAREVESDRYDFVVGDIFETDLRQFGTFDVVLYLGLMYHISKPMELMEKISEVNDDILVVDTTLSNASGSFLKIVPQDPDSYMSAVDRSIAMRPTKQAVRDLAEHFGYSVVTLEPDFRNAKGEPAWTGGGDYRMGLRRAFVCAKKTDLGRLAAEAEPAERSEPQSPRRRRPGRGEAAGAIPLLRRTDGVLSQLFLSRRWRLASALRAASQLLRGSRGPSPEDQLRELKGEFRPLLQRLGRASASGRRSKRRSGTS
jgi:2-polyprenyl-3-methyl-5-hydroxy-6-metoxy-1,4-benzoquinol methylase